MAEAKKKKVRKKSKWLMFIISLFIFSFLSMFGGYFALLYAGEQMIDMQKLEAIKLEPSVLIDKRGNEIGKLDASKNRDYVSINEIPKHVIDAFIAVEDKRFFEHKGIDFVRLAGALWKDIRTGSAAEGGSTITQQLARNVFLSNKKTFWRKTQEASIAISLERKFTKEQIMEMYLNNVYLGHGLFGIQAASQHFFDKEVKELTIEQAATLAAIPKAPTYYSPFNDPVKSKERRDTILRLMAEQGFITTAQKEAAQKVPLPEKKERVQSGYDKGYQAYIDYLVDEAETKYGISEELLYRGGWKVYTALDRKMQDAMIEAFKKPRNFPEDGASRQVEAGMVVIDPKNGGIAAMMGGRNYQAKGFNHAAGPQMRRQPGSSFKPLAVYAPALDSGNWNPYSALSNERQSFNGYEPRNYNNRYSESVTMYEAVVRSLNVPAVWLLDQIGVETGMEYVKKFGIDLDSQDRNLAIALGGLSSGTSPLKMAQAYTVFVNGGNMAHAHAIEKMEDIRSGESIVVEPKFTPVVSANAAWQTHKMLEGVVRDKAGTGRSAWFSSSHPVAGKTGTTQSLVGDSSANRDTWFVGYTPEYVGAVWMGFDNEDKQHLMRSVSSTPAKLFREVFKAGLAGTKASRFQRPDGVEEVKPQVEVKAPSLSAQLTIEGEAPKVILNWSGNEEGQVTYDVYRFIDSPDTKEKVSTGKSDRTYVEPVIDNILYKYYVVPIDAEGNEGPPSNIAEVDISQLDAILQDGERHDDQNTEQEGEEGQNGENPDNNGNSGNGNGEDGNGDGNGEGQPPIDIPVDGNQGGGLEQPDNPAQPGESGEEQPGERRGNNRRNNGN